MNINNPRRPTALINERETSLYVLHPTIQDNPDEWYVIPFSINQYNQPTEEYIKDILCNYTIYECIYEPKLGDYKKIYLKR